MVKRISTHRNSQRPGGALRRRRAHYVALGLALCELAALSPAMAQTASSGSSASAASTATPSSTSGQSAPASSTPAQGAPSQVQVVGERPAVINRIDRQVYDVKSDISSTNGTAADALNNVPSVSVDPDGTVSLRGNTNVQILVDGKPSAMLQGSDRGNTLQAMPADDIDSVEVINNPGAEFGNEGGGGPILNLVMKRNRRPGGFGQVNANYGSEGRYNSSVSGSYNTGPWAFQGGVNVRHDGRNSTSSDDRDQINPVTGTDEHSTDISSSRGLNDSAGVRGQLGYNLGQNDTLEASLFYMKRTNNATGLDHYTTGEDGATTSDYTRSTDRTGDSRNYSWGLRWDHKGAHPGETFKMDLRVSSNDSDSDTNYANRYLVAPTVVVGSLGSPFAGQNASSLQDSANDNRIIDYSGDYERPFDDGAILKLGYRLYDSKSSADVDYVDFDPATGDPVVNAVRSQAFTYNEHDAALYGSWQWQLNPRWSALAGLRTEYTHLDLDQAADASTASNNYLEWIPSAYLSYKVDEDTNVRFAYSHRIRRAAPNELNPVLVYQNDLNVSSGNPLLKPVQSDSFEIGYETKFGKLDTALRAFLRNDSDTIRSRQVQLPNQVILTTLENGGSNRSGGFEYTLSGKVTPKFSINASGNLNISQQDQIDIDGNELKRTATALSLRGRFNYQLTGDDALQAMINARGKTLVGAGYREPTATLNLTYRHNLTPQLSLVATVTDVFSSQKVDTVTDSATLQERTLSRYDGRIAYVGLSYRFGGANGNREGRGREGYRGGPPPGGGPGGDGGGGPGGGGPGGGGPGGGGPGM